jgi:TPR repeat protein
LQGAKSAGLTKCLVVAALLLAAFAGPAVAADLRKGVAAFLDGNRVVAWHELLPLARRGDAEAQYHVGIMYAHGFGTEADPTEARYWLEQAAAKGHADAMFSLGFERFQLGDYEGARRLLTPAAERGVPVAQYHLARMFRLGLGVPVDLTQAEHWALRAAEQDVEGAQFELGELYGRGAGGAPDLVRSYTWFFVADARRYPGAAENLEALAKVMTPEAIDGARRRGLEILSRRPPGR